MVTAAVVGLVGVAVFSAGEPEPAGVDTVRVPSTGRVVPPGRVATAVTVYVVLGVRPEKSAMGVGEVTVIGEPPPTGVSVTV
jgi:hypothetical protein